MAAKHWLKVVTLSGLMVGASAYAAPCNNTAVLKKFDEQRVMTKTEKSCQAKYAASTSTEESQEAEEVSWFDWAFDGSRTPSFHFINLLELLSLR